MQTSFVLTDLMKEEEKRIRISSVVLSSQRVDIRAALYNAAKVKISAQAARVVNPLIVEGQKLIPSVTRVFSKSRGMYVYLEAYERNVASAQPLVAFVTFYRGQKKAFETSPLQFMDGLDRVSTALLLKFSLSVAFLQVPVMLVPYKIKRTGDVGLAIAELKTTVDQNRFNARLQAEPAALYKQKQQTLQEIVREKKN